MTGALAVGDRGAAVFHLLSHGAFKALLFLAAGVIIHAAGTNSLAAMSRMSGLAQARPRRLLDDDRRAARARRDPALRRLLLQGSRPRRRRARRHSATPSGIPGAAGWIVLVAGLVTALLTAAYATRLWLLAFRGRGRRGPRPRQAARRHDRRAVGARRPLPRPRRSPTACCPTGSTATTSTPTLTTSVLGTGVALVGGLVTYGAWRHTTALRRPRPAGRRRRPPGRRRRPSSRPRPSPPTRPRTATSPPPPTRRTPAGCCSARCTATPPPASTSTPSTRALFVRPVQAAARLVRFLDREVVDTYVRGAGAGARLLGAAVRRAQTGNVQTYLERAARRLRRPGGRRRRRRHSGSVSRDRYQRVRDAVPSRVHRRRPARSAPPPRCCPPRPGCAAAARTRPCCGTA